jgi:DNA-binding response OmpR family regulator
MPANKSLPDPAVLLVERDVLVRMPLAAYLRDCGYTVIETGGGEEALTALQQDQYRVDVVLTDAELPGALDGFSLAQWVRKNRPEVSMLIAATPERAAAVAGKLCEEGPMLAKPYAHELVADRIRQLIASRRRSDS